MRSEFSLSDGSMGKNVTIFGADMTSLVYFDNMKKCFFILSESPTQGLDDTTLTAEGQYSTTFQDQIENFV